MSYSKFPNFLSNGYNFSDEMENFNKVPKFYSNTRLVNHGREKGNFEVEIICPGFFPKELSIQYINGKLIVKGKKEHKFVEQRFCYKISTPDIFDDELKSELTSDGFLSISAPLKKHNQQHKSITFRIPVKN